MSHFLQTRINTNMEFQCHRILTELFLDQHLNSDLWICFYFWDLWTTFEFTNFFKVKIAQRAHRMNAMWKKSAKKVQKGFLHCIIKQYWQCQRIMSNIMYVWHILTFFIMAHRFILVHLFAQQTVSDQDSKQRGQLLQAPDPLRPERPQVHCVAKFLVIWFHN